MKETWWDDTISAATVVLELNCPVMDINSSSPGTTGPAEVIANGESYYATQVIVAVPIGVLKASIDLDSEVQPGDPGYISFSPDLPADTVSCLPPYKMKWICLY